MESKNGGGCYSESQGLKHKGKSLIQNFRNEYTRKNTKNTRSGNIGKNNKPNSQGEKY